MLKNIFRLQSLRLKFLMEPLPTYTNVHYFNCIRCKRMARLVCYMKRWCPSNPIYSFFIFPLSFGHLLAVSRDVLSLDLCVDQPKIPTDPSPGGAINCMLFGNYTVKFVDMQLFILIRHHWQVKVKICNLISFIHSPVIFCC